MSTASPSSDDPRSRADGSGFVGAAPDPLAVEQTKQQIRSLVGEIAQLTKANVAPAEFYQQFLDRVVSALAAVGGAVWTIGDEGNLQLQYQISLPETQIDGSDAARQRHGRLLEAVLNEGEGVLVPPQSGGGQEQAGNPTDFLLVFGLLKTDVETRGIVEIFQRNEAGPNTQRGYLRFLTQMCELAADFLRSQQLRHFSHRQTLWTQLEEFSRVVHANLDPRATAYTIANEGRRLIECDRLSVAVCRGPKCVIEAVSGQDIVDRRANTVRLLERLAAAVTATGDAMWYAGDTRDLAPQVEDALQAYIDTSHSKTVAVLPLIRPKVEAAETGERRAPSEPPLAALVVEQIEDCRIAPGLRQRVDAVAQHSAAALGNALEHHAVFLLPVWKMLGQNSWITRARALPWIVSIGGGLAAIFLLLCLLPWSFTLESKGAMQPVVRRNVYAGTKGRVSEILVRHGDKVSAGDVLLRLRDTELEMAITDTEGQRLATVQQVMALQRLLLEPKGMTVEERNRQAGLLAESKEKLQSLTARHNLLKQKEQDLEVRSPIDGQVITWELQNRLENLPVQRGQMLLTVADPNEAWEVELRMPEHRVGYLVTAEQGIKKNDPKSELDVQFQLATDPGQTFRGKVREIHLGAELHGEDGNTVLVRVAIDKNELPHLRPGTTVTAKVACGYRPLGYVWFHDVWAFIRSRIIFRYL